jgi:hypothetical protein
MAGEAWLVDGARIKLAVLVEFIVFYIRPSELGWEEMTQVPNINFLISLIG